MREVKHIRLTWTEIKPHVEEEIAGFLANMRGDCLGYEYTATTELLEQIYHKLIHADHTAVSIELSTDQWMELCERVCARLAVPDGCFIENVETTRSNSLGSFVFDVTYTKPIEEAK